MPTDDLFPTVYTSFDRTCAVVRCRLSHWRLTERRAFRSAEEAWQHEVDFAHGYQQPRPDPAEYVIVSGAFTDDVDVHGAHLVIADWQHAYDPQGFYEEVERERQMARKRIIEEPKRELPECINMSPPWFKGRWRDWHRGHGCNKDDGKARTAEGHAEISAGPGGGDE